MITFCVSRRRRKMYCGHALLCVCVSVCLSAAVRPHYCTDADVTWGHGRGCPLVVHPSYKLVSILRYDDIVRTASWAGSALVAGRQPAGHGRHPQNRVPHTGSGRGRRTAADGGRSQHYCGSLECGLPLVAFWQQKVNAKC